jgi:hypothetical protein
MVKKKKVILGLVLLLASSCYGMEESKGESERSYVSNSISELSCQEDMNLPQADGDIEEGDLTKKIKPQSEVKPEPSEQLITKTNGCLTSFFASACCQDYVSFVASNVTVGVIFFYLYRHFK